MQTSDISSTALNQANQLLAFLVSKANPDWDQVMASTLSSAPASETSSVTEFSRAMGTVIAAMERIGAERPLGAVPGGTGLAKAEAGLDGEDSQQAVQALKHANRLVQCGKGRGKCLVVLSAQPVMQDELRQSPRPAEPVAVAVRAPGGGQSEEEVLGEAVVDQMLRGVRDSYRLLSRTHSGCESTRAELVGTIESLRSQLEAAHARIESMQAQQAMTWS